jgi:hypothetical protein
MIYKNDHEKQHRLPEEGNGGSPVPRLEIERPVDVGKRRREAADASMSISKP